MKDQAKSRILPVEEANKRVNGEKRLIITMIMIMIKGAIGQPVDVIKIILVAR